MKKLRSAIGAALLAAGLVSAAPAVAAHASSPYGCYDPSGWGDRVCYQIVGSGNYVQFFQGEVDNYWDFGIDMLTQVWGPGGRYYYANVYVPPYANGRPGVASWFQIEDRNLPSGRTCGVYGAPPASRQFNICYGVL